MKSIRGFLENVLSVVYILFLILVLLPFIKAIMLAHKLLLHLFGVDGEVEVIEYSEPYDHEDRCAQAIYRFADKRGKTAPGEGSSVYPLAQ